MGKFEKGNNFGNRFTPGKSGNPAGKARSSLLTDVVRRQLSDSDDLEAIATALIGKAKKGDLEAVKIILDRLEGRPKQPLEMDVSVHDWRETMQTFDISIEAMTDEINKLLTDANSDGYFDESGE
jgi:hypothetical protein